MKLICISNKVYVHPFDKDDEEEYSYKLWKYITTNK